MKLKGTGYGMVSVRWEKRKKRYQVSWQEDGTQRRKLFHYADVAHAFAARIERYRDEVRAGFKAPMPTLFADFCETYIAEVLSRRQKKASAHKESNRVRQIADGFKNFMLQDMTLIALKRFVGMRQDQGVSNKTINNELGAISAILSDAIDRGLLDSNPVSKIKKLPKVPRRRPRVVPEEDFERFLELANPRLRRLAIFLYNTGFRSDEALTLEWRDVDLKGSLIYKPSEEGRTNKTYRDRFVPMSDAVRLTLGTPGELTERVFPINEHTMRDQWDTTCQRAGVKFTRHDMRHTYISRMVHAMRKHGLDDKTISTFSGHATMSMLNNYTHLVAGDYEHVRNAVNVGGKWAANVIQLKHKVG